MIVFIIPFLFIKNGDVLTALSVSLTAVGAFATMFTAFVAIALYDKFGMDQKLLAKQTDKVLELVDLLKGKVIVIKIEGFEYLVRPSKSRLTQMKEQIPYFKEHCTRQLIATVDDYEIGMKELMAIKKSYWLPLGIKEKMAFFEFSMFLEVQTEDMKDFALVDFGTGRSGQIGRIYPEMTFKDFVGCLYNLVSEIEDWLKKNSSIVLDLKMEEPGTF